MSHATPIGGAWGREHWHGSVLPDRAASVSISQVCSIRPRIGPMLDFHCSGRLLATTSAAALPDSRLVRTTFFAGSSVATALISHNELVGKFFGTVELGKTKLKRLFNVEAWNARSPAYWCTGEGVAPMIPVTASRISAPPRQR